MRQRTKKDEPYTCVFVYAFSSIVSWLSHILFSHQLVYLLLLCRLPLLNQFHCTLLQVVGFSCTFTFWYVSLFGMCFTLVCTTSRVIPLPLFRRVWRVGLVKPFTLRTRCCMYPCPYCSSFVFSEEKKVSCKMSLAVVLGTFGSISSTTWCLPTLWP